ncbi:MAG: ABC transporter permease [Candidatus Magasanikbacteria bacterium]|nr:ABC transporter permease [Candidatus Magasanikbacteria bacterium]
MLFRDQLQSSYEVLIRQKLRTILTIMALGIGVASVVIIISAGKGLEGMVLGELDIYNPNTLNIEVRMPGKGHVTGMASMASGVEITSLKNTDMEDIGNLDNISAVYGYLTTQEVMKYQGQNKTVIIFGYGARAPEVEKIELSEGRFYSVEEENSLAQVVVIGSKIKDELFGADSAVGKNVYMDGKSFNVVGVLVERGASFGFDFDSLVYIPMLTAQKRLLGTDYMMGINARVIDMEKVEYTKADVEMLLRDSHNISDPDQDDFAVTTMEEIRATLETVLGGITLLLVALVCISLIVGGVGITNIMYVTVAERTFEIGLRKSLGATRTDILWQFLIEAMILTSAGGVYGLISGVLISYLIYYGATSYGLNWPFVVPLYAVFLALGFSTLVGLFFGIYPAKKAADLDPIVALRRE